MLHPIRGFQTARCMLDMIKTRNPLPVSEHAHAVALSLILHTPQQQQQPLCCVTHCLRPSKRAAATSTQIFGSFHRRPLGPRLSAHGAGGTGVVASPGAAMRVPLCPCGCSCRACSCPVLVRLQACKDQHVRAQELTRHNAVQLTSSVSLG
jgi:hypothetical protein